MTSATSGHTKKSVDVIKDDQRSLSRTLIDGSEWILLKAALLTLLVLIVAVLLLAPSLVISLSDRILGKKLIPADFSLTKGPVVQLISSNKAAIVWESQQRGAILQWGDSKTINCRGIPLRDDEGRRAALLFKEIVELQPGTTNFSILSAGASTESFVVTLPPTNPESIKLAVVGDNQYKSAIFSTILHYIKEESPAALLHLGDMVQEPWRDRDWRDYFLGPLRSSSVAPSIPLIITQGNHDIIDGEVNPRFPSPITLPDKPTGSYYALSLGSARVIILDTNMEDDAQVEWLREELASESCRRASFRIIAVHVPPFIEYWNPRAWRKGERRWPEYVRERLLPVWERGSVDLVLSGHQHNYQRGERAGITYVISGGGGGKLDKDRVEDWQMYEMTRIAHHYAMLDITSESIKITMRLADTNEIEDVHVIPKRGARR